MKCGNVYVQAAGADAPAAFAFVIKPASERTSGACRRFCPSAQGAAHFAARPARTSMSCAAMDMAISAGVSALMSRPMGVVTWSQSASDMP